MTEPAVKYVILPIDGSADYPLERMGGLTPLGVARTPAIDRLAVSGCTGTLATVPEGMTPDSAVANLSVLGYDPRECYQGRGVLEAASMGVELADADMALRCNLIGIADDAIADHSSGHISSDEAYQLLETVNRELADDEVEFHPGISYRHLTVLRGNRFDPRLHCWPPHDHVGRPIAECDIRALAPEAEPTADLLNRLSAKSRELFADHPVNRARRAAGKREAASLWFWAAGRKPVMETLQSRFGIRGAVISAVDLIHGLGRYAGMTSVKVEGATGLHDTNYEGKADAALETLENHDLVYVHVEGPDEAAHARDLGLKIHCIESIDRRLLTRLVSGCEERGWKTVFAVLPDHLTPVERGDHVSQPVPVLITDPDREPDNVTHLDEFHAPEGSLGPMAGDRFMNELLWRRLT